MIVDTTHLKDRKALLKALWNRSKPATFFSANGCAPLEFDDDAANDAINVQVPGGFQKGFIDYFCGRSIKANLSSDLVNAACYDRDNGVGAFQGVVDNMSRIQDTVPVKSYESHSFKDGFGKTTTGKDLQDSIIAVIRGYNKDAPDDSWMQFWQLIFDWDKSGLCSRDKLALMQDLIESLRSKHDNALHNPLGKFAILRLSMNESRFEYF